MYNDVIVFLLPFFFTFIKKNQKGLSVFFVVFCFNQLAILHLVHLCMYRFFVEEGNTNFLELLGNIPS